MSVFPRWFDDFNTDPTSDPAYDFDAAPVYDGVLDILDWSLVTTNSFVTLLNSNNNHGLAEFDIDMHNFGSVPITSKAVITVFGYHFLFTASFTFAFKEIDFSWSTATEAEVFANKPHVAFVLNNFAGRHIFKYISTPNGVDFYVDDVFIFSLSPTAAQFDTRVGSDSNGSGNNFSLHSILIKSDASLPKSPPLVVPAPAGAVAGASGPIEVDIPESRLYLDLGAFAGQVTGLSNVVHDPGVGANAMAENVGIPDRAGDTVGDFYLEIPLRGVATDYRMVFKESFVTTFSVVPTDDVDFDVDGGPSTQNQLVLEEDDLQCFIQKDPTNKFNRDSLRDYSGNNVVPHNIGADGNNYVSPVTSIFTDGGQVGNGQTVMEHDEGGSGPVSFPMLIDIDLGKIRKVKSVYFNTDDVFQGINHAISCTNIYSNTVPFVGAGLGQGSVEASNINPFTHITFPTGDVEDGLQFFTELNIETRFLRLEFQSGDLLSGGARKVLGQQIVIQSEPLERDSVNNNAQFQHQPASGGGFVVYPAGGVTQGDGQVEITLPTPLEVQSGQTDDFFRIFFKPDITD